MKKYSHLLNRFTKVKLEVKGLVDQFPKEFREQILFDKWSLKDVVAHLNHWMENDLDALRDLKKGKKSYWYPDVEEFNLQGVSKRKNWSWEKVYDEFATLIDGLDEEYRNLSDTEFEKDIWENHSGNPVRSLKVDIKHWEGEHIPQLKDKLRELSS